MTTKMPYVLGIDAGNTKTIALVAQTDGAIVGFGRSGCGDIYGGGGEPALVAIDEAATQALQMAQMERSTLRATIVSAAGADWPEDFAYLQAGLLKRNLGQPLIIYNDGIGALRAGSPDGTGVVVAVGTGTATAARAADGQVWHTGFWQEVQGSVELSRRTLWAVYRAALGIDPPTALTEVVLDFFGVTDVETILHQQTARQGKHPMPRGKLARLLLDVADQGDETARRLVRTHGAALGDYALAAARRVGIAATPFWLVLTGGVLRHPSPLLRDAIVERVHTKSPQAQPVTSQFEPAIGALLLALEAASQPIGQAVLTQIQQTMPQGDLFAT